MPNHTLAQLDAMSLQQAQALPFTERDALLDLIIADGRGQTTDLKSYRTGLYGDPRRPAAPAKSSRRQNTHPRHHPLRLRRRNHRRHPPRPIPRRLPPRPSIPACGRNNLRPRNHPSHIPNRHDQLAPPQPNLRRIHPQPALPRRHRHNRPSPTTPLHRNRQLHRLPRSKLAQIPRAFARHSQLAALI